MKQCWIASRLIGLALLLAPGCALPGFAQTPSKKNLGLSLHSFKTNLVEAGSSFWIDENQFVFTTLQEGVTERGDDYETPTRVALINFATKKISFIAQNARLLDDTFDRKKSHFLSERGNQQPCMYPGS